MIQRTATLNEQVDSSWLVRRAGRTLLISLQQAESAQRGFLLTGQASFLVDYQTAERMAFTRLDELEDRIAGDTVGEAAIEGLEASIRAKFTEMNATLDASRAGRVGQAITRVRSGRGKALMDDIRRDIDAIDELQGQRVTNYTNASAQSASTTLAVNAIAGLLILLLAGVVAMLVRRYFHDMTEARAVIDRTNAGLEQRVRDRTAALTRANEEVQRFAYIVSHDLRSPLVNVMGFTSELEAAGQTIDRQISRLETVAPDLIETDAVTAVREELPEAIGFIRASTAKMDGLINAILKLSREGRRNLVPETLGMTTLVQGIADSVRHQVDATEGQIVVEPLPDFESDRLSIEQILGNLIDNAVKYLDPSRPGQIVISGEALAGGWVRFSVADNGRGIALRDHERIFELFRRAGRQDTPGEGLGLAFVRNSVRRLGGSIEIESELGKGSTFHLKFPTRLILEKTGDTL
ncbi:sensor histidine kinase [Brevundimonas variabilis]|uniref:histidine kinase n=1 Tax=Brevundimonas variabilis TaxID=74312 RepID=A0A7W9CK14_9CAUL|nr:ATP-binding protein [Brevundimonas variabilis]MBB5746627.1 signal transduction histidine kinase [Brevundimonas variabilis]